MSEIVARLESCMGPVMAITMLPNERDQHLAMAAIRDGANGSEYCVWYVNIETMGFQDAGSGSCDRLGALLGCYNGTYFTTNSGEQNRMDAMCFFNRRLAEMIRAAFGLGPG